MEDRENAGDGEANGRRGRFGRSEGRTRTDESRPPSRRASPTGWSLVIASISIVAVAWLAMAMGSTTIGMIACVGVVVSVWGLVLAELVTRSSRSESDIEN